MNRLHATVPTMAKKYVWDIKYGLLGYPRFVAPEDVVRYFSSRISGERTILDLGCGRGSLLRALRTMGWAGSYCGVDISRYAIRSSLAIHDQRSSWVVSDFEAFRTPFTWDTVVMVEAICYIPLINIPRFLETVFSMIDEGGCLLFRLHDTVKFRDYVSAIQKICPQTEQIEEHLFRLCTAGAGTKTRAAVSS